MKMNEIKVRAAIAALPECIRKVDQPIGIVDYGEYDRIKNEMANRAASMAVEYADALVMALQQDVDSVKKSKGVPTLEELDKEVREIRNLVDELTNYG